jgi:hypothetical protein
MLLKLISMMEQFSSCIVVALGWGECRSWSWVMVSSGDFDGVDGWWLWGFHKLEVPMGQGR